MKVIKGALNAHAIPSGKKPVINRNENKRKWCHAIMKIEKFKKKSAKTARQAQYT